MHIFGKGAGARGGDGGERSQSFNKSNKRSLVMLAARQERGERGEHCGVTLMLPCNCPVKNLKSKKKCIPNTILTSSLDYVFSHGVEYSLGDYVGDNNLRSIHFYLRV